jgi:phosphate transport system permease protein
MDKIHIFTRITNYLQQRKKRSLLAGILTVLAGLSFASIGSVRLYEALETIMTNQSLIGNAFNQMISETFSGLLLILPCLIFFIAAFLIIESHSLGAKLTLLLSVPTLILGVITSSVTLTLTGVLCLLAAEIETLFRKKKLEKNSPVTTEKVAKIGLTFSALIGIMVLVAVIVYSAIRGWKYVNLDFITGANWDYINLKAFIDGTYFMGISDFIIGLFLIVGLGELIAIPLGLGAAIYMSEYAPDNKITSTIRFFVETLAGAPSIVIALFGYFLLIMPWLPASNSWGLGWYPSWLPAALCISFMILPWNIRIAEEAMKTVSYSFREGAFALGATRWQTVRRIVFFSALPGIITGLILGLGAALGETTVFLLLTDSGNTALPAGLPLIGAGNGMPTLPILIYRTYFYDIGGGLQAEFYRWEKVNIAFAGAFILLVIFLIISVIALLARNYAAKKWSGK